MFEGVLIMEVSLDLWGLEGMVSGGRVILY